MLKLCKISGVAAQIAVLLAGAATGALGCTYMSNPEPPIEYVATRTRAIVVGTVIQHRTRKIKDDGDTYLAHSLLFRVDENLKGDEREHLPYEYWDQLSNRSSCYVEPPHPKVGEQWVIFWVYDEGDGSARNVSDPRHLSWKLEPAEEWSRNRLQEVRAAASYKRSTVFGEVEMAMFDMPPDVSYGFRSELLDAGGAVIATTAVTKGRFSFPDLKPGKYVVCLRAPKQFSLFKQGAARLQAGGEAYVVDVPIQINPERPEFVNFAVLSP
jgi:hypothetical protein